VHLVGFIIRILLLLSVFLAVVPISLLSLFEIYVGILAYVSVWSIKCSNDDNSE